MASSDDLPLFMWSLCPETSANYEKCLQVDFPSDRTDDIALLNNVDGEATILKGVLMKEPAVRVSVTIDGNILEVCGKIRQIKHQQKYGVKSVRFHFLISHFDFKIDRDAQLT